MAITSRLPVITMYKGDNAPTLQFTINKNDNTGALDLTGFTITCLIRLIGATADVFTGSATNANIISAITGRVDYTLPTGGLTDPGVYICQLKAVLPGGAIQRFQKFQIACEEVA